MKKRKKVFLRIVKLTALILICISTLCAQECKIDTKDIPGALWALATALMGSSNEKVQETGAVVAFGALTLEFIQSDSANFNPAEIIENFSNQGIEPQSAIIANRNRQIEREKRLEEAKAEDEHHRQERAETIASWEREPFVNTLPAGISSVTTPKSEQNIGNPQVNHVASANGSTLSSRTPAGRRASAERQRSGGNVAYRPRNVTGRDGNTVSISNNATGRNNNAPSVTNQQPQQVQMNTSDTNSARAAITSLPIPPIPVIPQIPSNSVSATPGPNLSLTTPVSKPSQLQDILNTDTLVLVLGGYRFKNAEVQQSVERLSNIGREILKAIDEVAKELMVYIIITDGQRSWEVQLVYLLQRPKSYPNVTKDFKEKFDREPPETGSELITIVNKEQENGWDWYRERIERQIQIPNGFPHVGGRAIDISVAKFNVDEKGRLAELLIARGIQVKYEYITDTEADYNATIEKANVFHLYK